MIIITASIIIIITTTIKTIIIMTHQTRLRIKLEEINNKTLTQEEDSENIEIKTSNTS